MDAYEDLFQVFREEAADLLANLESCLLEMETKPDDMDLVDAAFRALHTIKGAGAMYGFNEAAELAHDVERLFSDIRSGRSAVRYEVVQLALGARDTLAALTAADESDRAAAAQEAERIRARIADYSATVFDSVLDEGEQNRPYELRLHPDPDLFERGVRLAGLLDELARLGASDLQVDASAVPPLEEIRPHECYLGFRARIEITDRRELERVLLFLGADEWSLDPLFSDVAAAHTPTCVETAGAPEVEASDRREIGTETRSVRVDADRLEELVDLVGELVTAQAALKTLAEESGDARAEAIAEQLERLTQGLRGTVLGVRMVRIGSVFGRFRRYVRDLADELGKQVVLSADGAGTELDKTVIDRIDEPLLHLLRNALDHGLETPAEREAAGKSREGHVTLSASQSGGSVYLRVSDDGRGLDMDEIRAKVARAGSVGDVSDEQALLRAMFAPGFSTASSVTAVSGRGVGLDAVKQAVDDLQGSVEVETVKGHGSTFTIRLPLTLAIIDGLVVDVADETFVLPLTAVDECVELDQSDSWCSRERDLAVIRGELVPCIRLRDFFGAGGTAPGELAVVVGFAGKRVALVVDRVVDQTQVVIKSLGRALRHVQGISGATVAGDGQVALIVDVGHLLSRVERGSSRSGAAVDALLGAKESERSGAR